MTDDCEVGLGLFANRPLLNWLPDWVRRSQREQPLGVLLGFVVLAALMPMMILGAFAMYRFASTERASDLERVSEVAATLARGVDRELLSFIDTAEILAGLRYLQRGELDTFDQVARDTAAKTGGHFILIDQYFQQRVNTRVPSGAPLPKTANVDSVRQVFESGQSTVGDLGVGAVAQRLVFSVLVPVNIDGEARYVLAYVPRSNAILEVVQQTYRPEGWFAAVLDGGGKLLARSARHDEFFGETASPEFKALIAGPNGVIESQDLEGRASVTGHYRSDRSAWRAVVWVPETLLADPANQAFNLMLAMAVLSLSLSVAASLLAGRMIQQPARRLIKAARALGDGQPVVVAPTLMREANFVVNALAEASRMIAMRESALRDSEKQTRFVMRELSHRSKNLLAIVQAMARQTARAATDYEEFQERFASRISSLARSHDLLVNQNWKGIAISDLVSTQLAPFVDVAGARLTMDGPSLVLEPDAAQTIGMALHELATNASKYGAFSVPAGRVRVEWSLRVEDCDQQRLTMRWQESGGPPVAPPTRNGFGHTVVEHMAANSLGGTAKLLWEPTGVAWCLDVPATCLADMKTPVDLPGLSGSY